MPSSLIHAKIESSSTRQGRVPRTAEVTRRVPTAPQQRVGAPTAGGLPWSFGQISVLAPGERSLSRANRALRTGDSTLAHPAKARGRGGR